MANTVKDISSALATKIAGLENESSIKHLAAVFEYPNGDFKKYPVAIILPTGGSEGKTIDTHRVERTFGFEITYYQEQDGSGKDKPDAYTAMREAIDATIVAFDQDRDLGGAVSQVNVVRMEFDFKASAGTGLFARFAVDCVAVVPNYSVES